MAKQVPNKLITTKEQYIFITLVIGSIFIKIKTQK